MSTFTLEEATEATREYFGGDELATSVFLNKYAMTNTEGELLEKTPDDLFKRLSREFARIESNYKNPLSSDEIYKLLSTMDIIAQGSPMSGIGNPYQLQSLSNCFVINSPSDSYAGILQTDQEQVQLMKRRGGVGFDISPIRPKGMRTSNAAKTTDGIGIFLERFSNSTREVAQGGRRGALMVSLSCSHPEIETFIDIKRDLTKVTGANISVRLTDEFLNAAINNEEFMLQWPVDSEDPKITKVVNARELWDKIIDSAHAMAEPGVFFWDNVIKNSLPDCYSDLGFNTVSSNPCLTGDTLVDTNAGLKTMKELADNNATLFVKSFNIEAKKVEMKPAVAFKTKDNAKILKIKTKSGKELRLTPDHRVYTDKGYIEAQYLTKEHKILSLK